LVAGLGVTAGGLANSKTRPQTSSTLAGHERGFIRGRKFSTAWLQIYVFIVVRDTLSDFKTNETSVKK
jgi:hypothetical protein